MRLKSEQEILDPVIRKKIIDEINGPENKARKDEAFKRYQCYKDQTYRYVIKELLKQFDETTVEEMSYAVSNINVAKKIVDKLARVYSNGVKRTVVNDEPSTLKIEELSKELEFNTQMKKTNRFLKLQKNIPVQVCPYPINQNGEEKYAFDIKPLQPFFYDAVEDFYRREEPICFILSSYEPADGLKYSVEPAREGRGLTTPQIRPLGDGKDQIIADTPSDQDVKKKEYIWWAKSYHFTTDEKGDVISQGDGLNPINELPFVNFAIDQDGSFWAIGGDDIVDGSIRINSLITNNDHIGVTQGYGQFFMKGKNLPRFVKLGPNKAILMEYEKDDPTPELGFAQATPSLAELKNQLEMYIALLLSTNNLSTSGISAQLNGSQNLASGIALILDKAESTEDVKDQEQIFLDREPEIWEVLQKFMSVYESKGLLADELRPYLLPDDFELRLKFGDARPIMSETEKIDAIQKRKDAGLNTMVELLMMDDPSLTEQDAKAKLEAIAKEKADRMKASSQVVMTPNEPQRPQQNMDMPQEQVQ